MKRSNWKIRALALTLAVSAAFGMVAAPVSAGWYQTGDNWYYTNDNGALIRNRFEQINGKWYMFDRNGSMMTGWYQMPNSSNWYYLRQDGSAVVGEWFYDPGAGWYYMGPDGKMDVGWLKQNGTWYYLMEDGRMCSSWREITVDGRTDWYYFNSDGSMKCSSWLSYKGDWYYFDANGRMLTDCTTTINKVDYTFDSEGRMVEPSASLDIYNAMEKAVLATHTGVTDLFSMSTSIAPSMLSDAFNLTTANIVSSYGKMSGNIVNCSMMLVVEAADGKVDVVRAEMEKALAVRKEQNEWYGAVNGALCASAKVIVQDRYVALVMIGVSKGNDFDYADDVAVAEKAFRNAAK